MLTLSSEQQLLFLQLVNIIIKAKEFNSQRKKRKFLHMIEARAQDIVTLIDIPFIYGCETHISLAMQL